jgi:hypothetical protein
MLQDPGGNRSHLLADGHSETLQSSIILPVQVSDLEFDFLLANIGWLILDKVQTSQRSWGYLGSKFDHRSGLLAV